MIEDMPIFKRLERNIGSENSELGGSEWPEDTEIFLLSESVSDAMYDLLDKENAAIKNGTYRYASLMDRLTDLRMPYDNMIIEFPLPERARGKKQKVGVDQSGIDRLGAHVNWVHHKTIVDGEEVYGAMVIVRPFWRFAATETTPSTVGGDNIVLAMVNVPPEYLPGKTPETAAFKQTNYAISLGEHDQTPTPVAVFPSERLMNYMLSASKSLDIPIEELVELPDYVKMMNVMTEDSISELSHLVFATEAILNCKTGLGTYTQRKDNVRSLLSRKSKAKKKAPARNYTYVYLKDAERVEAGRVVKRADVQAHMVRGHMKRRATGVYWWNPFMRGKGKLKKREAYVVKDSPNESMELQLNKDVRHVSPEVPRGEG